PVDALRLQYTLREPISLISAYDVWLDEANLIPLSKEFRKQGILLLDSGGYESSRISRYAREESGDRWTYGKYAKVAGHDIYDFIFSFDYFLREDEASGQFSKRILAEFRRHADILDITKLIPVVHVRTIDSKRALPDEELIELFREVASEMECRFIAI